MNFIKIYKIVDINIPRGHFNKFLLIDLEKCF